MGPNTPKEKTTTKRGAPQRQSHEDLTAEENSCYYKAGSVFQHQPEIFSSATPKHLGQACDTLGDTPVFAQANVLTFPSAGF